jgi:nucleotide-binding universal stress UspA family protein
MKLLVAVDLSESSRTIIDRVKAITGDHTAWVWILHNAVPEPGFVEFKVDPVAAREALAKRFHAEHRQIQELADSLRREGLEATALLVHGPTVETILQEAEDLDVDMIVVGSHGHGAMYNLLMGSVTEEILHKSRFPVLVVPTHNRN